MSFLSQIGIGLLTFLLVEFLLAGLTLSLSFFWKIAFYAAVWLFWQAVFGVRGKGRGR